MDYFSYFFLKFMHFIDILSFLSMIFLLSDFNYSSFDSLKNTHSILLQ